ncbi:MAG: hypothetical protein GF331_24530 [Chitinivibrionales bacterium]|nr:hypothetical protein [Chitinivibrionales bacterium]
MSRTVTSINSSWEFFRGDKPGADTAWQRVNLPHCWNSRDLPEAGTALAPIAASAAAGFAGYGSTEGRDYYRGVGWYRKVLPPLTLDDGQRVCLRFEGANQDATVMVNGTRVGEHLGGYTAFTIDLTEALSAESENLLEVRLSNAHNDAVPPVGGDLGHFGGIYRPVWLIRTGPVHFDLSHYGSDGVYWRTPEVSRESARLALRARIVNHARTERDVTWATDILASDGELVATLTSEAVLAPDGACTVLDQETVISRPCLWSPDTPHVYRIRHRIADTHTGEELDTVHSPLGFRSFDIDPARGLFLNGEHCFLRGVGRHQDYPGLGYAVPVETLRADTRTIKRMGANAMRSHYPLCDDIYDECDRAGLIVWAKIPVMDQMNESDEFLRNARTMFTELILQAGRHPSILIWGYACEILGGADWFWPKPPDPAKLARHFDRAVHFCRDLDALARELDPQRLTCNDFHGDPNPQWYRETGLTEVNDINGWNVYHGWYHRSLDEVASWLEQTRAYAPSRPYILAEFGAGVDQRIHAHEPTIFDMSPEYSHAFHETYREVARKLPWLAGVFIWTWSDFQRTSLGDTMGHLNNKGMLTNDRCPKDAFYQYQAWWGAEPMVHISGHANCRRAGIASEDGTLSESVRVYSNEAQVTLEINGVDLGRKRIVDGTAEWRCGLHDGVNRLVARGETQTDMVSVKADVFPRDLRQWRRADQALCINVGQSRCAYTDPLTDRVWMPDREYGAGGYGHVDGRYFRSWPAMLAWDGIREGVSRHIRGTHDQAVFQTFLVGVTEYRVDLADGRYEVTLLFCEPFDAATRGGSSVDHGADESGSRVFDVSLQGATAIERLDCAAQYGELSAISESFDVDIDGGQGLRVGLAPVKGLPVLSGLSVVRVS